MREVFKQYLFERNIRKSGKASSYLKALEYLDLVIHHFGHLSIYQVTSPPVVQELYNSVLAEQKKGTQSIFSGIITSESYWRKGYISAALRAYETFLEEDKYISEALSAYSQDIPFERITEHIEAMPEMGIDFVGKETVATRRVRLNQQVFARKVREAYNATCCITGLSFAKLNRAGHIIPWSERESIRLDPRNGIYLSATYDVAFDRHLISLDQEYRLIVGSSLKEFYTKDIFQEYFQRVEGTQIALPAVPFRPKEEYLAWHRERLV